MTPYRENLVRTYNTLLDLHEELLTRIINVEMSGELEEIGNTFEPGDSYQFEIEQFRDSTDANVQLLIDLFDQLESQMNTLANINALTEAELDQVRAEDELDYLDEEE